MQQNQSISPSLVLPTYTSMHEFATNYEALLVDLWGVIHDGIEAYDGVHECLVSLKKAGVKVVFISNAPRPKQKAIDKLEELGVNGSMYDHVFTSGDMTINYLKKHKQELGNNYYMLGPSRDDGLTDGLGFTRQEQMKDANFVIVTGFDNDDSTLDDVKPHIHQALEHKLPIICANPDLLVVRKTGKEALCAGVIANYYIEQGGKALQFGKPYPTVYQHAINYLGITDLSKIAAVGDNLDTDIKGANSQTIDSYLIPGGILGRELNITHGQLPENDSMVKLCNRHKATPTALLSEFVWNES